MTKSLKSAALFLLWPFAKALGGAAATALLRSLLPALTPVLLAALTGGSSSPFSAKKTAKSGDQKNIFARRSSKDEQADTSSIWHSLAIIAFVVAFSIAIVKLIVHLRRKISQQSARLSTQLDVPDASAELYPSSSASIATSSDNSEIAVAERRNHAGKITIEIDPQVAKAVTKIEIK